MESNDYSWEQNHEQPKSPRGTRLMRGQERKISSFLLIVVVGNLFVTRYDLVSNSYDKKSRDKTRKVPSTTDIKKVSTSYSVVVVVGLKENYLRMRLS